MQFYLNGYVPGDPRVQPIANGHSDHQQPLPDEVDVLIVGSGPAGTLLGAMLSQFPEFTTRIVEMAQGPLPVGRADGVSCRTVETFAMFGLAGRLMEEGYWVNQTHFWGPMPGQASGIQRFGRVQDVRDGLSEFPHLLLNQARLTQFLLEFMANSATRLKVDYKHKTLHVQKPKSDADPVLVTLDTPSGERTIRARYVVGCDGAHSIVRQSIGRVAQGQGEDKTWGVLDVLANTDFPDIRFKCTIQNANGGNILLIPREGGYLFRLYVDCGNVACGKQLETNDILTAAKKTLLPYTLDVKQVAWSSVYRVGHRVTDKFDDVDEVGSRTPRIFLAGDACHTHTAKAGQGMNVSMQDALNLGWKLVAVLQGRSPPHLLDTYSQERKVIAEDLIAMDKSWSRVIGDAQRDNNGDEDDNSGSGFAEVQRQFVVYGEFTAGMATCYAAPSLLTAPNVITQGQHQNLAKGFPVGRRFHSDEVMRLADGKRVQLGSDAHRADGRWRLYAFADVVDPRTSGGSRFVRLMTWLAGPQSVVARFTPPNTDVDGVFDVRGIVQQPVTDIAWIDMPLFLRPTKGNLGLVDYEKAYAPVRGVMRDIFDTRSVDRGVGALVVVRPDQYVALVLPLGAYCELQEFFAGFMLEPGGGVKKEGLAE